jgi:integrase
MRSQDALPGGLQPQWRSPFELKPYDRNPALTDVECETLARLMDHYQQGGAKRWSAQAKANLNRLWEPLHDIVEGIEGQRTVDYTVSHVLINEMHRRKMSYWGWTEQEWQETIGDSVATFVERQGWGAPSRLKLMVIAYLLGKFPFRGALIPQFIHRERIARKVFGDGIIDVAVERVCSIVAGKEGWGYSLANSRRAIKLAVSWVFLVNRNPYLEAISLELLVSLRELAPYTRIVTGLFHLSQALVELDVIERALPPISQAQPPWVRLKANDIASEWTQWCHHWYKGATGLALTTKDGYLHTLYKAGRWLASTHPEVTSPQQWTYRIAAEWVQAVDTMKVGDWIVELRPHAKKRGQLLRPRSKVQHLVALKVFFRDLQEEPLHLPRTFNPYQAFRIPQAMSRLIGPDPRDIDARWWAMIVQAALDLTEEDLPRMNAGYPLALIRALAIVWVYSGLRSDELVRLRMGCIRWQHEDVTVPETGGTDPERGFLFPDRPSEQNLHVLFQTGEYHCWKSYQ